MPEPNSLSAVNLTAQRVDRVVKVGAGGVVRLLLSTDGRRLFCYTSTKWQRKGGGPRPQMGAYDWIRNLKPPFEPVINVIDTASNEVIATYEWFESYRATVPKGYFFARWIAGTTSDGEHLIVANKATNKPALHVTLLGQQLAIFSGRSPHPAFTIDPGGEVKATAFSQNQRFFFVAVEKSGQRTGLLDIVDLETSSTTNRALTELPRKLIRLGRQQQMWLLGGQEMRSVSETGELGDRPILLNKPRRSEEGGKSSAEAFLDGYPGETISLGEDHAAMLITDKNGVSRHRVALLDLKALQVDSIVETMSHTAKRAGIRTGRIVAAWR